MEVLRVWRDLVPEAPPAPSEAVEVYVVGIEEAELGQYQTAAHLLTRCLGPMERMSAAEAAAANHNLAVVLQNLEDRDGAVFHCFRAKFLFQRAKDSGGLYACLRNLAVIHASRGETRLATGAQYKAARTRRELIERGTLDEVEAGVDFRGNRLLLLGLDSARNSDAGETPAPETRLRAVGNGG